MLLEFCIIIMLVACCCGGCSADRAEVDWLRERAAPSTLAMDDPIIMSAEGGSAPITAAISGEDAEWLGDAYLLRLAGVLYTPFPFDPLP